MYIDPNSIRTGDLSVSASKTTPLPPELSQLLMDLKATPAQKFLAVVSQISEISLEEKRLLIELRSSNSESPTAQRTLIALLNDPNLKLIELKIDQARVNTLTSLNLMIDQEIEVIITKSGLKIVPKPLESENSLQQLLNLTSNKGKGSPLAPNRQSGESVPNQTIDTQYATPRQRVLLAEPHFVKTLLTTSPKRSLNEVQLSVRQAMNHALPDSRPHTNLFNALAHISLQISKAEQEHVPKQLKLLVQGLNITLAKHNLLVTSTSAPSVPQLKQALLRSGTFYEQQNLSPTHSPKTGAMEASSPKFLSDSSMALASTTRSPSVEEDLKGSLLKLGIWIQQLLKVDNRPNVSLKSDDIFTKLLLNILNPDGFHSRQIERPNIADVNHYLQKLLRQSIAQIQVQQYKTLTSQTKDATPSPNSFHFDIPVKTPDGYSNIYMQLFEPKINPEEKTSRQERRLKKKAKWRVYMEFELGEEGSFATELTLSEKKMGAVFWAEKDDLRQKAKDSILKLRQNLEENGLEVTDITCSKDLPPRQKIEMDFSLIDVKT